MASKSRAKTTATKKPATPKASVTDAPPQPRDDSGEIVVFAIRLKRIERDEIHNAAGSAKASSFVRGLALAAARGDMKALTEIVDNVKR